MTARTASQRGSANRWKGQQAERAVAKWLPVVGYEGLYEVSDVGEVWSLPRFDNCHTYLRRRSGRYLAQTVNSRGYLTVGLSRDGRASTRGVHNLVLEAFVGARPQDAQTRHLNGQQLDNRLTNLAWGTGVENAADKLRHGTDYFVNINCPKTHCNRGHRLAAPNLIEEVLAKQRKRVCLACQVARHNVRGRDSSEPALQAEADRVLEQLLTTGTWKQQPRTHCSAGHELSTGNVYTDRRGRRECVTCKREYGKARRATQGNAPSPAVVNAAKTECVRGHELSGTNLRVSDGRRHCRACVRERAQQRRRKLA